jgi:hypothetical protein
MAIISNFISNNVLAIASQLNPKSAQEAIEAAKKQNQYLFLLFYDQKNDSLKAMETVVKTFINKSPQKIITYKALTTDNKEADIVAKYGINRAPLPVVLTFAPNGAITGGFPQKVDESQLKQCFVADITMRILKTLQEQKIALIMLQNEKTTFNQESTAAANDFANDSRVKGYVDLMKIDPDDPKNKDFLNQCKLNWQNKEATIVLIVPPNKLGGIYPGKTTKDALIQGLTACSSGGCGSGGCN